MGMPASLSKDDTYLNKRVDSKYNNKDVCMKVRRIHFYFIVPTTSNTLAVCELAGSMIKHTLNGRSTNAHNIESKTSRCMSIWEWEPMEGASLGGVLRNAKVCCLLHKIGNRSNFFKKEIKIAFGPVREHAMGN